MKGVRIFHCASVRSVGYDLREVWFLVLFIMVEWPFSLAIPLYERGWRLIKHALNEKQKSIFYAPVLKRYPITAGIPLKFPDNHAVIAVEHGGNISLAVVRPQMKFNFLSFIQGYGLASHRPISSLDSA